MCMLDTVMLDIAPQHSLLAPRWIQSGELAVRSAAVKRHAVEELSKPLLALPALNSSALVSPHRTCGIVNVDRC